MIDIRIQTFLTVCETMNYTRASELLHITQPAVSQHIHFLEEEYACRLFSYTGRKLCLTTEGKMLQHMAIVVQNDDALLKKQLAEKKITEIPIHFGVTMTIGEYVIAKPLSQFLRRFPNADIHMAIGNTEKLIAGLNSGELHCALMEGYFDKKDFDSLTYATVPFIPVCSAKHSFTKRPQLLQDLTNERLLLREPGSGTRDVLEKQLAVMGMEVENFASIVEIGGMHAILQLLEEDAGISFLYKAAAETLIRNGILQEIPLQDFKIKHDFAFIWEKGSSYKEMYEKIFRELIRKEKNKAV